MAVGDLLVDDYDFEYDGLLLVGDGAREFMSCNVMDSPEIRVSDRVRGQLDGEFQGTDYYAGRTFVLTVEVWGENESQFLSSYRDLQAKVRLQRTEIPLAFRLPGWETDLFINCKPRAVSGPMINLEFGFYRGEVAVQFHATDPRIYSLTELTGQALIMSTSDGMEFNLVFDLSFGGLSVSNSILATNTGSYETPWEAVITGPITNPKIEHVEQGKTLEFAGTLAADEFLVIQSKPRANILLGGTASRYSWLLDSSQWFMLTPGLNTIRFQGSTVGSPTMDFSWRSAWA